MIEVNRASGVIGARACAGRITGLSRPAQAMTHGVVRKLAVNSEPNIRHYYGCGGHAERARDSACYQSL